jgi:hypothetical protein
MASFLDRIKDWVSGVENEKLDIEGVDLPEVPRKSSLDLGADEVLDALGFGSPSEEEIAAAVTPKTRDESKEIAQPNRMPMISGTTDQGEDITPIDEIIITKPESKKEVESKLSNDTVLPQLPGTYETPDQSTQEDAPKLSPQELLLEELRKQKAEFGEKLKKSKDRDRWISLLEAGLPFLQQYVQGTTGTKTGLPTVAKPIKLDLDPFKTSKDVMAERQQALDDLLTEYKLQKPKRRDIRKIGNALVEITPEGHNVLERFKPEMTEAQKETLIERRLNRELRKEQKEERDVEKISTRFEKSGVLNLEESLDKIDNILRKFKGKDIPGFGIGGSMRPEFTLGTDAKNLRILISNLKNVELKKRSGAAVTEPEMERFLEEFGEGKFKTEESLLLGLKKLRDAVTKDKKTILSGYPKEAQDIFLGRMGETRQSTKQELNQKDQQALNKAKENPESEISKKVIKHLEGKYGRKF